MSKRGRIKRGNAPVTLKPFLNPGLMDKKYVETLCLKSTFLYGRKWRWRKLCAKASCTPEELEQRMDIAINKIKENYEQLNQKRAVSRDQESTGSEDNSGSTIDGQEIRSEQANDGIITTGGTD